MTEELKALRDRIERLDPAVGEYRDRLENCLKVANRPPDAIGLARSAAENVVQLVLKALGLKKLKFEEALGKLEEQEIRSRGLIPAEILSMFHLIRVLGNKALHNDLRIEATTVEVILVLGSLLRAVQWYYSEFKQGPRIAPLFRPVQGAPNPAWHGPADDSLWEVLGSSREAAGWRKLALAYIEEVRLKFAFWHHRYVSLSAQATVEPSTSLLPVQPQDSDWTPSYFRPRGYRLTYPEPLAGPPPGKPITQDFKDVRQAIARAGEAVLLGNPGAGKTTSLWRLMLDFSEQALIDSTAPLPVLIPLGGYDGIADILEYIRHQLAGAFLEDETGRPYPLSAHQGMALRLDDALAQQRLILLLDGVNEMPRDSHRQTVDKLWAFRAAHPGNRTIFSCRDTDYVTRLPLPEIRIKPLEDDGIRDFILAYSPERGEGLIAYLEEHPPLREMGRNPYLLRMMIAVHKERGTLAANPSEVLADFVGALLRREFFTHRDRWQAYRCQPTAQKRAALVAGLIGFWPSLADWIAHPDRYDLDRLEESDRHSLVIGAGLAVHAVSQVAYAMSKAGQRGTTIPTKSLKKHLAKTIRLNGVPVDVANDRLLYLLQSASLLENTPNGFRFVHQLLQEYFTAVYLAGQQDPLQQLPQLLFESRFWAEVLIFLSSLLPTTSRLFTALLRSGGENWQVFLAARCLIEGKKSGADEVGEVLASLEQITLYGETHAVIEKEYYHADWEDWWVRFRAELWEAEEEAKQPLPYDGSDADLIERRNFEEQEIADIHVRERALDYICAIGERYPSLPIENSLELIIRELLYERDRGMGLDTRDGAVSIAIMTSLCERNPKRGKKYLLSIVRDGGLPAASRVIAAEILHDAGYADADVELLAMIDDNLDFEGRESILIAFDKVGKRRTITRLARIYNRRELSDDTLEMIRAVLIDLCDDFDCRYAFDPVTDSFQILR